MNGEFTILFLLCLLIEISLICLFKYNWCKPKTAKHYNVLRFLASERKFDSYYSIGNSLEKLKFF